MGTDVFWGRGRVASFAAWSRRFFGGEDRCEQLFFGKIGKTRHFFRKMVKIYGSDNRVAAKTPFPPRSLKKRKKSFNT